MKRLITIVNIILVCSLAASAQTLTGVVTNGTTQKPAASDEVILLKLGQGMEEQARAKTDSQGRFSFKISDPRSPYLVRVRHQNVNYHEPVPPGKNNLAVTVYNVMPKVSDLKLVDQSEVFQPEPTILKVIEVLRVQNSSVPPVTQPSLDFYLPDGAKPERGEVLPPGGMPVNSAPVPLPEKNKYSYVFPLRPGVTQFELVYTMPYSGSLKLQSRVPLPAEKFFVVLPKSVKFSAADGSPFHEEQWALEPQMDVNTYAVTGAMPNKQLAFEIYGTGALPQDNPQQGASSANGREDTRPGGGLGVPNERPNPLSSGQWAFLGVIALFLAGGAGFLFFTHRAPATANSGTALLDALKEEMFQLESERAQGKISPKEYESAKSALDKTLQRAMKQKRPAAAGN